SFAASPRAPSVFPLTSCPGEATTSQVTFGCLVKGYFPEPVTVQWTPNTSGVKDYPSVLQTSSGLYSLSSQVTVSDSSWEDNTYHCTIKHEPTSSSITKEIPTAGKTTPITAPLSTSPPAQASPRKSQNPPLPSLPLCKSTTPPANSPPAPSTSSAMSPASTPHPYVPTTTSNILVFTVPPSPEELYVGQSPKVTCLVVNLPNDADLRVVWSREKTGPLSPEPLTLTEQHNRTFTASSSLPIFTRDWEDGEKYSCKVEHSELPTPIIKSISKKQGKMSPPSVYLLRPHPDELSSNGDSVSLTCLVRGYYPAEISVKWMENHESQTSMKPVTTSSMKEGDGDSTYFLYSKLPVDKTSWNNGVTYTCMVIHEALKPLKFTQRNIRSVPEVIMNDEFCTEEGDEKIDGLWSTIAVFITLFLLSVCYSATVTLFKVKWLFSSVVQLKRGRGPEYKNVIQRVV
uniref:Ig-like domain-containing protein n=1 Tax=Pelodiscus sinensis TaxID=13735 RepID=K7FL06_PELSI